MTHYPDRTGGTNKRLDRIYISSALAKTNWPGLADSEHVDPSRLSALGGSEDPQSRRLGMYSNLRLHGDDS